MTESELICACIRQDRQAQQQVYNIHSPKVFGICKRYMKDRERAEEMAMNAFISAFKSIGQYKNDGSLEGWLLRIAVNCCLMELRKKTSFANETTPDAIQLIAPDDTLCHLYENDIEKMLKILPDGARIVFNLYAIEGYKHSEIAKQLGITEGTSKSQLNYAKQKLKKAFFASANNKKAGDGR